MKRIIFIAVALMFLSQVNVSAQQRGALTNVFASWANVSTTASTFFLTSNSRDVYIANGSTTDICVDLRGGSVDTECTASDGYFQLDGASDVYLSDFITDKISVVAMSGTASPVSVVVTY